MDKVLDHGSVSCYNEMADDLSVVNSARVSFGKEVSELDDADIGLINYLMKHRHGTPFEHNSFTFRVVAPIFVFREWQRHRIGSFNEMSARYTTLPNKWYIPDTANVRSRVGKAGHYTYEPAPEEVANEYRETLDGMCESCYNLYIDFIDDGIAPEQARLFLHVNHYSEMFWTVNARSLMNFLALRNHPTAQWEIQQYAIAIEKIFKMVMPHTYRAFVANDRIAP